MSKMRPRLQKLLADVDCMTYASHFAPSLTDEMTARVRRFHHAACEVSGTNITRRHAFHILLDAGLKALGNDVIKAAKEG